MHCWVKLKIAIFIKPNINLTKFKINSKRNQTELESKHQKKRKSNSETRLKQLLFKSKKEKPYLNTILLLNYNEIPKRVNVDIIQGPIQPSHTCLLAPFSETFGLPPLVEEL